MRVERDALLAQERSASAAKARAGLRSPTQHPPEDVTNDATDAAIEAAIIRHYAATRLGPRVTDVIITRWWVKEKYEDRLVFEGQPTLVSSSHFAVEPLNLYLPAGRLTEFDEVILTLRFEE